MRSAWHTRGNARPRAKSIGGEYVKFWGRGGRAPLSSNSVKFRQIGQICVLSNFGRSSGPGPTVPSNSVKFLRTSGPLPSNFAVISSKFTKFGHFRLILAAFRQIPSNLGGARAPCSSAPSNFPSNFSPSAGPGPRVRQIPSNPSNPVKFFGPSGPYLLPPYGRGTR